MYSRAFQVRTVRTLDEHSNKNIIKKYEMCNLILIISNSDICHLFMNNETYDMTYSLLIIYYNSYVMIYRTFKMQYMHQ